MQWTKHAYNFGNKIQYCANQTPSRQLPGNEPGLIKQGEDHQRADAENDSPDHLGPFACGDEQSTQRLNSGCIRRSSLSIDLAHGQQQEHTDHQERFADRLKYSPEEDCPERQDFIVLFKDRV